MKKQRPSYEELEQKLRDLQAQIEAMRAEDNENTLKGGHPLLPVSDSFPSVNLIRAFSAIKDHIWILDKNHNILWQNHDVSQELGCCLQISYEEPCFFQLHGVSEPIDGCPVVHARQSKKRESFEICHDEKYYEVIADPIVNGEGQLDGFVHILSDITATRKAQLALEETENLFKWLSEKANDIIYRYEFKPHHRFTYVSPSVTRITGYSPEEHYADPELGMKIVHPDDRVLLAAYFGQSGNFETPLELRWVKKDGTVFWTEQRNVPIYKDGQLIAIEGIARDITKQKIAKEKQKELERQLQTIIVNINGLVYRCKFDPNWTMEYISPACLSLTGYSPEELINNKAVSFNDIIHPDWREYCWQAWQKALPDKQTVELEYPIITKTGEVKWVWERGCGVYNAEGSLIALEGFITDISKRRNADEELRKLSRTVEQSPVSVVITDTEGIIEYVNEKFTFLTGYSKAEAIGQNPRILQSGVQGRLFYQKM